MRRALEQSLNAATVPARARRRARACRPRGARRPASRVRSSRCPALTLGSFEVTPLELAAAYATLAELGARPGRRRRPAASWTATGWCWRSSRPRPEPVLRAARRYLLTHLLQRRRGARNGRAGAGPGIDGAVAGKTGTTNDGRDAWFVGYTPGLVRAGVGGIRRRDVLRLSGGQAALPIWTDFMRSASAVVPGGTFPAPAAVMFRDIDPLNGQLAGAFCPVALPEAFLRRHRAPGALRRPRARRGRGQALPPLLRLVQPPPGAAGQPALGGGQALTSIHLATRCRRLFRSQSLTPARRYGARRRRSRDHVPPPARRHATAIASSARFAS